MAPVVPPQENTESFLLEGTGVFMLTPEQRRARRLSVVVEKVATAPRVEYLNLTTPEPKGFWGYLQLVQRDFIVETIALNYRRQVVLTRDNPELEPIEQLRCLVKASTLTVFDLVAAAFLAAGGDAEEIGQQRALYLLAAGQSRFIPTLPETGIYYEIENDRAAKITVIWQGYLEPCENPGGYQYLQPPRAPEKDESSPDGASGGGTRPTDPPPADRTSDPDSDNETPPPGTPEIPTPAPPPQGPVIYKADWRVRFCVYNSREQTYRMRDSFGSTTGPGPFTTSFEPVGTGRRLSVVDATGVKTVVLSGQGLSVAMGCPEEASVTILSQGPV